MLKIDLGYGEYFEKFSIGDEKLLSKEEFEKYIKDAKLFLESLISTSLRKEHLEKTKDCLFALTRELAFEQKLGNVRSENIDGYSVSFAEKAPLEQRLFKIVSLYLGKSGLLYAGVE